MGLPLWHGRSHDVQPCELEGQCRRGVERLHDQTLGEGRLSAGVCSSSMLVPTLMVFRASAARSAATCCRPPCGRSNEAPVPGTSAPLVTCTVVMVFGWHRCVRTMVAYMDARSWMMQWYSKCRIRHTNNVKRGDVEFIRIVHDRFTYGRMRA